MLHGWGWNGGMGIGIAHGIIPLLIVTVLILGGFWVIRTIYRDRTGSDNLETYPGTTRDNEKAPEILRQRYARGEITREQFFSMKEDIG